MVQTPIGELRVELGANPPPAAAKDKITIAIRPEKVTLCTLGECAGENRIKVKIAEVIYIGSETHYVLRAGEQTLTAEAMNVKIGPQGFEIGHEAIVYLPAAGLLVLDD
jgi:ABC-type Fe3+/spermidine/putrescine transport system ATPase subunit